MSLSDSIYFKKDACISLCVCILIFRLCIYCLVLTSRCVDSHYIVSVLYIVESLASEII